MVPDVVDIKEYFEKILIEKDKAIAIALSAAKEAVMIAEANSDKWRANANEWRAAMTDRESKFMGVDVGKAIEREIAELRKFREAMSGVLSDIANLQNDSREVRDFMIRQNGKADQTALAKTNTLAMISGVGSIIAIIIGLINLLSKM